ncbi:hypothetical protein PENTCL1PPCAC_5791, partial [Pristionchus entomophagus]
FSEARAQSRTLQNVSYWLKPQSRSIDPFNPTEITFDQLEKACDGPIRGTQFAATTYHISILSSVLDLAEGLLVEYAGTAGYKLTEFHLPSGYSLVSTLQNCDPGKELDLTLAVLQSIVNGNEAFWDHAEITERLKKLSETKDKLEKDGSEFPKIFPSLVDRITNYDEVSEQEIQEFIDEIEKDKSYQSHIVSFANHPYLLKGLKHVQFLQRAYAAMTTINSHFYAGCLSIMASIVGNLSGDELENALAASEDHFKTVAHKTCQYVSELKSAGGKSGVVFAARLLLLGQTAACNQLATLLNDKDEKMAKSCEEILSQMPSPLHKMLLESDNPLMLRTLFGEKGLFFNSNFGRPMKHLVLPGIFPLHKLLNVMLKNSQAFRNHLSKVLNCEHLRSCILKADAHREETAQALISAFSIVAYPESRVNSKLIRNLLCGMKCKCEDESDELTWMSKYDNYERVAMFIDLFKKPDDSAEKPTREENGLATGNEEVKDEAEKEKNDDGEKKKDDEKGEDGEKKEDEEGKKNVKDEKENKKLEEKTKPMSKTQREKEKKREKERKKKEGKNKRIREEKEQRDKKGGVK